MLGISPPIAEVIDANLTISTESAKILASQFVRSPMEFWFPLITSIAAVVAAFMSYFASKKSVQLSHNLFINELNREYALISDRLFDEFRPELPLSNKNKKSMCNFFQKICALYYQGMINKAELSSYAADLFNKPFVDYADNTNKKDRTLGSYIRWLCENNKLNR